MDYFFNLQDWFRICSIYSTTSEQPVLYFVVQIKREIKVMHFVHKHKNIYFSLKFKNWCTSHMNNSDKNNRFLICLKLGFEKTANQVIAL